MNLRFILLLSLIANIALGADLKTITAEQFLSNNSSPEAKIIVDYITHQFDGKTVTQAEIDNLWNNKEARNEQHLIRFQIVKQKLYADTFDVSCLYFIRLLQYFQEFLQKYKVNDVDFIVYGRDEITPNNNLDQKSLAIPAFMMSKNLKADYEKDKLLLPDAHMLMKSWGELAKKIEIANTLNPWDEKMNKIFWRGASTGSAAENLYNIANFDKFARLKLVILSKLYPDLIDAKLNRYPDFSNDKDGDNLKKILELLFGDDNEMIKEVDHLKYKYLIAMDGNTCPWVRVPWIMLSNSVLLKQESNKIEWFYSSLKPYVHYVPVREDLTDIFKQIEWMKEHDLELKQISLNAQNFVKNNLMPEHIDAHMTIILNEYHNIQQDDKIIATLTPADDVISVKSVAMVIIKRIKKYFIKLYSNYFE